VSAATTGPQPLARSVSGGWRAERSCCFARNAAAWRQEKEIANEPLRAKVGERSERIVARDPPAKTAMAIEAIETGLKEGMAQRRSAAMTIFGFELPEISSTHPFDTPR